MHPRLSIIAAAIRRIIASGVFVEPTSDPYLDNVVLSLRMESSDPYYNQVVLGMHMDDVDLTDVKGKTATLSGNVARSATQSKFGGYSAVFDGAGDYISFADHADFSLGSTFTIEAWIYCNSFTDENIICSQTDSGSNGEQYFGVDTSGNVYIITNNGSWVFTYGPAPILINTWYHVAVTCNAGVTKVFVNGIHGSIGTFTNWSDRSVNFIVGASLNPGASSYSYTNGYIDDLRITKGVARYTKNFSIPTAAFPEPANTAIDDKGKTVTTVGGAQFSGVSKYGSGSFYFDGTGDYLSVANTGDFNFGSGDFTIETFVRLNVNNTVQGIFDGRGTTNDMVTAMVVSVSAAGKLDMGASTANAGVDGLTWNIRLIGASPLSTGAWHHVAITRSGSTWRVFLNGTQDAVGTSSITIGNLAATVYMGTACNGVGTLGHYLNGYLDDLRVTKGVARYTANFIPYKILTNAPAGDPYYNYTSLLMKMDGTNGGTTFTDNSYSAKTVSVFGNSNTSTAAFKYGTASAYLDGTGDYLTVPDSADFAFGAGDFTIECWFKQGATGGTYALAAQRTTTTSSYSFAFQITGSTLTLICSTSGTATTHTATVAYTQETASWHHAAAVRSGTNLIVFIDGVAGTPVGISTTALADSAAVLSIGGDTTGSSNQFNGYLDDLRITKGVARYTAMFQPPGPHIAAIDPDTDQWWLNTVLALRMDGTNGSTTITDLKGKSVTAVGNAAISASVSKFGQAAYFDGTGDYLTVPNSTDFDFGTSDFTIEFWINTVAVNGILIGKRPNVSWGPFVLGINTNKLQVRLGTGVGSFAVDITSTDSINTGLWVHVAVTRASSTVRMFVNGVVQSSTATLASALYVITDPVYIGSNSDGTEALTGYIDDLRITNGAARYTATFTPSEKPLPTYLTGPDHDQYWDKVVLACPFNTDASDARQNTPTLVGNATISTAQKMFGTGSAYFDGTGDYITYPDSDNWHLASNDFTIEAWIRPEAYPASNGGQYSFGIVTQDATANRSFALLVLGTASSLTNLYFIGCADNTTGYTDAIGSCSFSLAKWHHVAVTRSGNFIYLFVDGILLNPGGTAFSRNIQNSTTTLKIGAYEFDATYKYYFNGYIDDVRFTKGIARYTASFELPTKANILG